MPEGHHYILEAVLPEGGDVTKSICIRGSHREKTIIEYKLDRGSSDVCMGTDQIWAFENATLWEFNGGFERNIILTNVQLRFAKDFWEEMSNLDAAHVDFVAAEDDISTKCEECGKIDWRWGGTETTDASLLMCRFHNCTISSDCLL